MWVKTYRGEEVSSEHKAKGVAGTILVDRSQGESMPRRCGEQYGHSVPRSRGKGESTVLSQLTEQTFAKTDICSV